MSIAGWLMLFAEAAAVSDDDRVHEAAAGLAAGLRESWGRERRDRRRRGRRRRLSPGRSRRAFPAPDLQAAIDELERLVGAAYRARRRPLAGGRRRARAAGRSRQRRLRAADGLRVHRPPAVLDARGGADAVRGAHARGCRAPAVLRRRNRRRSPSRSTAKRPRCCTVSTRFTAPTSIRDAAVVAPAADYGRDAERILRWLAPQVPELGLAGAVYGLAAADWHSACFEIGNPPSTIALPCPSIARRSFLL